ncbi:MAG: PAS domain-containing protein [Thermoleophilia bacterium]|nr:PAS domain-containing protein [Thermoleophilia bacterium]
MRFVFSRISFTTRLLLAAAVITCGLVAIDYATLLKLPHRVARDSVELALRENTSAFNAELADQREQLRTAVTPLFNSDAFQDAVKRDDVEKVQAMLPAPTLQGVRVAIVPSIDAQPGQFGVVTVQEPFNFRRDASRTVVFYRDLDTALLDSAVAATGNLVAFAVKDGAGSIVARSSAFPTSIRATRIYAGPDPNNGGTLKDIKVGGDELHLFSRRLGQENPFQLLALSTPQLEDATLSDTRGGVRNAIVGMTVATILGSLMLAFFASRTVRSFASRVRELADGQYGVQLPVHGSDGFADLAGSVNRLSLELESRLAQLEDTASAFRRTLETLDEGICTWSEAGTVDYWNRGAEQLTGVARERATQTDPIVAFLAAERTPGARRVTLPVRRTGGGLTVDLVVTSMPGGGVLQTFRDTSMLDILQQTQRNFMATASHELRTPITTILGFADTLTNADLELTLEQRENFLCIIHEQSHHLQEITEAFFTNQQLANERVEVSIAPTGLGRSVEDAISRERLTLGDRATQLDSLVVDVPDELFVLADQRALMGVISVLVDNAVKYGAAPIRISAERTGGSVALLVTDAGPGIDPYHHDRVFDPFYRIDVDMRSGVGGAGLGLFTARKLMEAMHGLIRVRSSPGAGATFIVELPGAPVGAGHEPSLDSSNLRLVV